jgi:hypothetical protein
MLKFAAIGLGLGLAAIHAQDQAPIHVSDIKVVQQSWQANVTNVSSKTNLRICPGARIFG